MFKKIEPTSINIVSIPILIQVTITRIDMAMSSGKFGSQTSSIFSGARRLLDKLEKLEMSDEDKLKKFDSIVIGAITFAMASESDKYGNKECLTPLSVRDLCYKINEFPTQITRPKSYDDFGSPIGDVTEEYLHGPFLKPIETLGEKMLVDKIIEPFQPSVLFCNHKISIEDLQLLKAMAENNLNTECNQQQLKI